MDRYLRNELAKQKLDVVADIIVVKKMRAALKQLLNIAIQIDPSVHIIFDEGGDRELYSIAISGGYLFITNDNKVK